jgi:hypothetical protein
MHSNYTRAKVWLVKCLANWLHQPCVVMARRGTSGGRMGANVTLNCSREDVNDGYQHWCVEVLVFEG